MDSDVTSNLQVRSFRPASGVWKKIALAAMEEIGTPVSLAIYLQLTYGEFEAVARRKVDPLLYNCRERFQKDFAAVELLRKFDGLPGSSPAKRRAAALEKAAGAEDQCASTNRRITDWVHGTGFPPGVERLLLKARRKIFRVLGSYDLDEHIDACRWGPGSDFLNRRPYVSSYHKFRGGFASTRGALLFLPAVMQRNHLLATWLGGNGSVEGLFTPLGPVVAGNSASTVPKTALTDRFICIEPGANVYLQLGLGQCIRRRLRRAGVADLTSQELNQTRARQGSKTSYWCTIDLSSASDTVARELVRYLFDHNDTTRKWYAIMDRLRSPFTNYGTRGKPRWLLNHKFSSMGNGFTFELETLIFWVLANAVAEDNDGEVAAVYGDDIIVSRDIYHKVCELLHACGFTVNTAKSFCAGYFRESCGENAWDGVSLVSYRLETLSDLAGMYSLHNGLRRIGCHRAANVCLRAIPTSIRFFGPECAGDSVLHETRHQAWSTIENYRGLANGWFFWETEIEGLKFVAAKTAVRTYEPAILHSFATMVPIDDRNPYGGGRWGSEGFATLSTGEWTVGAIRLRRTSMENFEVALS